MSESQPILLISPPMRGAGFGACILTALNYIRYCEREALTPVMCFDASCETRFLDPEYGENVWEQYFEPVGPLSSADVPRMLDDSGRAPAVRRVDASLPEQIKANEDSVFTWTFAHWRENVPEDLPAWFAEQRRKGRESVHKHVRVLPRVLEKVDAFHRRNMVGKHVLGVHIRGTDLSYAPPVTPAEYFPVIDAYLGDHTDAKIFLATDQVQYLDLLTKRYGPLVMHYDCLRSESATAPFQMDAGSPYRKGEDVLIDILLLSRCAFLVRGASNVPEMAIYFSDHLESEDLSLNKRFAFGQDYLARWIPQATRPAWDIIKNTDLESVPKGASSQTRAQKIRYELRRAQKTLGRTWRRFRLRVRSLFGRERSRS